jgi:hypothetical protein
VYKPFKADFSHFFSVGFLSSEGHVTEEVFHETCMAVLDERLPYDCNVFVG